LISSSIGQQIFYNGENPGNFSSIALNPGYTAILYIIFKQQIHETYVKILIKKISNYYTL